MKNDLNFSRFILGMLFISSLLFGRNTPMIDIETLQQQLQLLHTPQEATVAWDEVASNCLKVADDFLNYRYDYRSAKEWFLPVITLYEKQLLSPSMRSEVIQSYVGIAMAYHGVGRGDDRNAALEKARSLLAISADINTYKPEQYEALASGYYVMEGYRFYITYEQSRKNRESIDQQEQCLHRAQECFLKAIDIVQVCNAQELEKAHASQGLGTVFEFLSLCEQERNNNEQAAAYLDTSCGFFKQAIDIRIRLLGEHHPHVARSYHKCARNYALRAKLIAHDNSAHAPQALYQEADNYYQKALAIFERTTIPYEQAKRLELEQEYKKFKLYILIK